MSLYEKYPGLLDADFVAGYDMAACWTVENPKGAVLDLDVAIALLQASGNMARAADLLKRPRRVVDRAIIDDIALFDFVCDIEGKYLDDVEERLRKAALQGDISAVKFVLSTKGKDRGYTQRGEITGANGAPVETVVQYQLPSNGRDE